MLFLVIAVAASWFGASSIEQKNLAEAQAAQARSVVDLNNHAQIEYMERVLAEQLALEEFIRSIENDEKNGEFLDTPIPSDITDRM